MAQTKMMRLPALSSIRDIVKLYRLNAVKQLSQNFLMNETLTNRIVKQAGSLKNAHVVEVGPGPGGITRSIIQKFPKKLIVIEKDKRFKPSLEMLANAFATMNGEMNIIFNDIMVTDMSNMFPEEEKRAWDDNCPKIHIIGNLPFNVSTPLIIKWLHAICERRNAWVMGRTKMTLTFQKEVAERLVAEVREHQRCRLSVMAQAWTEPKLKFIIPGYSFVPQPDVDVGVVTFTPLIQPRTCHDFKLFEKITRHVFSFRQKYSITCVKTLFPPEYREQLGAMMYKLSDLDPTIRPTQLSVENIDRLCTAYKYLCEKHPEIKLYDYRASRRILSENNTQNVEIEEFDEDETLVA